MRTRTEALASFTDLDDVLIWACIITWRHHVQYPLEKKSTKKIYKATRLNTNTDIYYDHVAWFLPLACDVCMHATLSAIYVRVICIMIICTSYKIIELFQSFEISPARAYINRNDIGPFFQGKISILIYFLGLSAYKYI